MKLKYNNSEIMVTITNNKKILCYKFQKLYYAIIIENCNCYSSILNKQRIDVLMVDSNLKVLSIKRNMHENTIFEDKNAIKTILLPIGTFLNLKINDKLLLDS